MESIFRLREDSPLPVWAILPKETARSEVDVTMTLYTANSSRWKVHFVFKSKSGKVFMKKNGEAFWHPDSARQPTPGSVFPNWIVVEVDNTLEVYEQSESNDLLKIVKK